MKLVLMFFDDNLVEYSHVCDGEFSRELLDDLHSKAEEKFGAIDTGGTDVQEEWDCLEIDFLGSSLEDVSNWINEVRKDISSETSGV